MKKDTKEPLSKDLQGLKNFITGNSKSLKLNKILTQVNDIVSFDLGVGKIDKGHFKGFSQGEKENLESLNELAKVFSTKPYTAIIQTEEDDQNKFYLSASEKLKNVGELKEALCNYTNSLDDNNKIILYARMVEAGNGILETRLSNYDSTKDQEEKRNSKYSSEKQPSNFFKPLKQDIESIICFLKGKDFIKEDEKFKSWIKEFELFVKHDDMLDVGKLTNLDIDALQDISGSTNTCHVEVSGIAKISANAAKDNKIIKQFNVGLAHSGDKDAPACCASCTAEIKTLNENGFDIKVSAYAPQNMPRGNFVVSENITESNNPKIYNQYLAMCKESLESVKISYDQKCKLKTYLLTRKLNDDIDNEIKSYDKKIQNNIYKKNKEKLIVKYTSQKNDLEWEKKERLKILRKCGDDDNKVEKIESFIKDIDKIISNFQLEQEPPHIQKSKEVEQNPKKSETRSQTHVDKERARRKARQLKRGGI